MDFVFFLSLSKSILSCAGGTRKVCRARNLYYCRITLLFLRIFTSFFTISPFRIFILSGIIDIWYDLTLPMVAWLDTGRTGRK
jgi:hypothetical protein